MKPLNQRIGKVAQILMIPLVAFTLGRMSVEPFSGSGWAWASVVLSVLVLVVLLAPAVAIAWMSKD
jgi:O-antigen/teichoic acid export membrane protein